MRSVSSHSPHSAVESTGWEQAGYWLSQHRWAVTIATIAVCVAGGQGLRWFHTETKNIHNFPQDSQIVRDYRFLEEEVAGVVPVQLIVRFQKSRDSASTGADFLEHMALVRALEDKLREYPDISGTLSLADFFPVVQPLPPTASVVERLMDRRRANEMRKRIRQADPTRLKAFLTVAPTASDLNVTGDHRLNQPGDELWRITAQVAILSDLDYSDLVNDLHHIAQSVLAKHPGTGHVVTGVVPLFLETQRAVLDSLIRSFALAFAVIAVVMMIVLKHPLAGLLAMLPNLQPIVVVFGLISWFGLSVNIGTMITASVALGIAVDGTLHLMTWFRTGVAGDLPRQEAVAQALAHCGPAMWQTSLAVGAGLLMLYPANLLLISRFGWLMAALIAAALLADIVFLPALLAGRLGCLIQKTVAPLASLATPQESVDPQLADERRTDQSDSIHCKCGFTSEVQSL